jgi:HSP20 family protein
MLPVFRTRLPFSPFAGSTANGLDLLFDRFFGDDGGALKPATTSNLATPLAVWQDDEHVHLEVDVPGVNEPDLEITVHDGVLTIKGERRDEEGRTYLFNGRTFGRFERVVTLPEAVDSEKVEATLTNGVLRVTLAKLPQSKPRKIALKTS